MKFTSSGAAALVLVTLAFPSPRAARADDAKPAEAAAQVTAAVAELDAAMKAKDDGAAAGAAKKVGALYKGQTDAALKTQIVKELSSLVKIAKLPAGRAAALAALVETEDGPAVWKGLSSQYPKDDVDDPEKFNIEILKAIGQLHPDGAVELLLESFRKAKAADVAAAAVSALGNYHKSKKREVILEEVVKAGKNMIPSKSATKQPGAEAQARWATLSGAIGKALDTLTGNSVGDPAAWFKKVDDAKKPYKELFKD